MPPYVYSYKFTVSIFFILKVFWELEYNRKLEPASEVNWCCDLLVLRTQLLTQLNSTRLKSTRILGGWLGVICCARESTWLYIHWYIYKYIFWTTHSKSTVGKSGSCRPNNVKTKRRRNIWCRRSLTKHGIMRIVGVSGVIFGDSIRVETQTAQMSIPRKEIYLLSVIWVAVLEISSSNVLLIFILQVSLCTLSKPTGLTF